MVQLRSALIAYVLAATVLAAPTPYDSSIELEARVHIPKIHVPKIHVPKIHHKTQKAQTALDAASVAVDATNAVQNAQAQNQQRDLVDDLEARISIPKIHVPKVHIPKIHHKTQKAQTAVDIAGAVVDGVNTAQANQQRDLVDDLEARISIPRVRLPKLPKINLPKPHHHKHHKGDIAQSVVGAAATGAQAAAPTQTAQDQPPSARDLVEDLEARIIIPKIHIPKVHIPKIHHKTEKAQTAVDIAGAVVNGVQANQQRDLVEDLEARISIPRVRLPKLPKINLPKPHHHKHHKGDIAQSVVGAAATGAQAAAPTQTAQDQPPSARELVEDLEARISIPKVRLPKLPKINLPKPHHHKHHKGDIAQSVVGAAATVAQAATPTQTAQDQPPSARDLADDLEARTVPKIKVPKVHIPKVKHKTEKAQLAIDAAGVAVDAANAVQNAKANAQANQQRDLYEYEFEERDLFEDEDM